MTKFKDLQLQRVYVTCLDRGADDFMRRQDGAMQCAFMNGYKDLPANPPYEKMSVTHACFVAGMDKAKAERQGKVQPVEVKDKRLLEMR